MKSKSHHEERVSKRLNIRIKQDGRKDYCEEKWNIWRGSKMWSNLYGVKNAMMHLAHLSFLSGRSFIPNVPQKKIAQESKVVRSAF